jgi:hypothetical protein
VRSNPDILAYYHLSGTAKMPDNRTSKGDLRTVTDLHAFRVFVLYVDLITDKNMPVDPHTPAPV